MCSQGTRARPWVKRLFWQTQGGRVNSRPGWASEKSDLFSILLKFGNAQRFADHQGSG